MSRQEIKRYGSKKRSHPRLFRWLHSHRVHWFCRVAVVKERVLDRISYEPEYLIGADGRKIDVTTYGGTAFYVNEYRVGHH